MDLWQPVGVPLREKVDDEPPSPLHGIARAIHLARMADDVRACQKAKLSLIVFLQALMAGPNTRNANLIH